MPDSMLSAEERQAIARQVAAEVARLSAGAAAGADLSAADAIECFTCSGRFKCRPSFLIQSPGTGGSTGGAGGSGG